LIEEALQGAFRVTGRGDILLLMHDELFADQPTGNAASADDNVEDDAVYFVVGDHLPVASDSQAYAGILRTVADEASAPIEKVKAEWDRMMARVATLLESAKQAAAPGPFELQEIQLQLAFTAKGHIAFIAEAGVQAGVTLTFRPKQNHSPV
jgi:hypothetical protein